MALILEDRYVRISDIRIGKNVMQFNCKTYDSSDLNKPELDSRLITCSYNINISNPYIQAYSYLKTVSPYNQYTSDEMINQEQENIITEIPEKEFIPDDLLEVTEAKLPANDLIESKKLKSKKPKSKIILG